MRIWIVAMAVVVVSGQVTVGHGAVDHQLATVLDQYVGESLILRKRINGSNLYYLNDEWDTYWCHSDGRLYLYDGDLTVEVVGYGALDDKSGGVWLEYEERVAGKQRVEIRGSVDPGELAATIPTVMGHLFVDPATDGSYVNFTREPESGVVHAALCNHVPRDQQTVGLNALGAADSPSLCSFCFKPVVFIDDYDVEMALGRQVESTYQGQNRQCIDPDLNARAQAVGRRVLETWPFPLMGYHYDFLVSDSREPNACACPGGVIYINRGLLEALPDDDDLAAVLAHEISHVELRHGYHLLKQAEEAANWGMFASAVIGVAAGAATDNAGIGVAVAASVAVLSQIAATVSVSGYSQDQEIESDVVAAVYVDSRGGEGDRYARLLRALEYYRNSYHGATDTEAFASHPSTGVRLELHGNQRITWFDDLHFQGLANDGSNLGEMRPRVLVEASYLFEDEIEDEFGGTTFIRRLTHRSFLFVDVAARRELRAPCEIKDVTLTCLAADGLSQEIRFDNETDPRIYPNQEISVLFKADKVEFGEGPIEELNANMGPVKEWR